MAGRSRRRCRGRAGVAGARRRRVRYRAPADRRRVGRRVHGCGGRVARSRRVARDRPRRSASTSRTASTTSAGPRASAASARATSSTSSTRDFMRMITDCYLPGRTTDERRAPEISPAYAVLARAPALLRERRHVRPPARRLTALRVPGGGCGRGGRPVRVARDAARVPDVRLRDHPGVVGRAIRLDGHAAVLTCTYTAMRC